MTKWISVKDNPPNSGPIIKKWNSGAVWAGNYSGSAKDSSFDFWLPLPGYIHQRTPSVA